MTSARCLKCLKPFCDACLAFSVNGAAWCEPCGHTLLEELKPRWVMAGAIFGGALALVVFGYVAFVRATGRVMIGGPTILVAAFLSGAAHLSWQALSRSTGDKPRVERRLTR